MSRGVCFRVGKKLNAKMAVFAGWIQLPAEMVYRRFTTRKSVFGKGIGRFPGKKQ
jgi:hypothetical protein